MTRNEKITHNNFAVLELVRKGGVIGWACRRCALLVAAGLLGVSVGWPSSAALGSVDVLERSYNHFRTGTNTAETSLRRQMSDRLQTSSIDGL
jgi:hypothetical protein